MKFKNYYDTLGVARTASQDEIKKAYRKLAHKYHPDVSKETGAEEKFKDLQEAYSTLKDAEKRAAYDELGDRPAGQEFRPPPAWNHGATDGGFSFDDIDLSDLFAAMGQSRGREGRSSGAMRGEDYETSATITLEQVQTGTELELHTTRHEEDADGNVRAKQHRMTVRIPKGPTEGEQLRLRGRGGPGKNGGPAGDIYLTIHLKPHKLFSVDGHNLSIDLPLTPSEAALGASVTIPTLAGDVELNVPAGKQPGQKLRLPRKGLVRPSGDPGDLFAIIRVVVPTTLTEAQRALYEQLGALSGADVRSHFP